MKTEDLIKSYAKHQAAAMPAAAQPTDDLWNEIAAIAETREAAKERAEKLVSPRPRKQ